MKKREVLFAILAIVLILPLASAGLMDFITGKDVANQLPTNMQAEIGNTAPQITYVADIPAQTPTEANSKAVIFKVTVYDHDSNIPAVDDMSAGSVLAKFTKTGETTRSTTCSATGGEAAGANKNYTCTIDIWYWDGAGSWTVNVTASDNSAANATNDTTTLTINSLTAFTLAPSTITWGILSPGAPDQSAINDPSILNNTGNYVVSAGNIKINATDLIGFTDPSNTIGAGNFTSAITDPACTGDQLSTGIFTPITGANLDKGNLSIGSGTAQQTLYYCLDVPSSVTKQNYTASGANAWTIKIA